MEWVLKANIDTVYIEGAVKAKEAARIDIAVSIDS